MNFHIFDAAQIAAVLTGLLCFLYKDRLRIAFLKRFFFSF